MGILRQTKYLLRKNYLIKRRNLRETLQEVLVPIWWVVLLLVIGLSIPKQKLAPVRDSDIPTFNVSALAPSSSGREGFIVGYVVNDIQNASRVIENMNNFSGKVSYLEFNNTDSMLDYYRKYSESTGFEMGIEFAKGKSDKMAYTLHVGTKSASIPNPEERLTGKCLYFCLWLHSMERPVFCSKQFPLMIIFVMYLQVRKEDIIPKPYRHTYHQPTAPSPAPPPPTRANPCALGSCVGAACKVSPD